MFKLLRQLRSDFILGLTTPLAAGRMIVSSPRLLALSAAPVLLTAVIYFYGIAAAQTHIKSWMLHYMASWGLSPESWLAWSLFLLSKLVLMLAAAITFSFVANVVSSPLNDWLAESAEAPAGLPPVHKSGIGFKATVLMIDLAKTVVTAAASVAALVLSWVPVVNIIAFMFAFLMVSYQYVSYPQTRRGMGIMRSFAFLLRHPLPNLGFGMVMMFLFSIPLLSALFLPVGVVGGTLLVGRLVGRPHKRV
ncbi:MAG: hypothetical protein A2583_06665 [Bdellovibrionales bacterium RIFOXYD1_FULL_53_11]|nr:MAG: hypothetical protein A2583_06665 [Bdellovibrionales bacterium RIFOXYD1_FULL_53_11]